MVPHLRQKMLSLQKAIMETLSEKSSRIHLSMIKMSNAIKTEDEQDPNKIEQLKKYTQTSSMELDSYVTVINL